MPNKTNPEGNAPRHIVIEMVTLTLKSSKGKATSCIKGNFHKTINWLSVDSSSRNLAGQKRYTWYNHSDKRGKPTTKNNHQGYQSDGKSFTDKQKHH